MRESQFGMFTRHNPCGPTTSNEPRGRQCQSRVGSICWSAGTLVPTTLVPTQELPQSLARELPMVPEGVNCPQRLGPNVEPGHLSPGTGVPLHTLYDLSPRPGITGRLTMRRKPLM
jgi:hypothetical protein